MAENDTYWSCSGTSPDTMDYYVDNTLMLRLVGVSSNTANDTYHIVSSIIPGDILDYYVGNKLLVRQVG